MFPYPRRLSIIGLAIRDPVHRGAFQSLNPAVPACPNRAAAAILGVKQSQGVCSGRRLIWSASGIFADEFALTQTPARAQHAAAKAMGL